MSPHRGANWPNWEVHATTREEREREREKERLTVKNVTSFRYSSFLNFTSTKAGGKKDDLHFEFQTFDVEKFQHLKEREEGMSF